jgi:hypothetical protein
MPTGSKTARSSILSCSFSRAAKWGAIMILACTPVYALQSADSVPTGSEGGASAVWIFANLSFTGMRAQDRGGTFWKVVSFIFGFPATLLTLMVVQKGSERAYGIDMPRRQAR